MSQLKGKDPKKTEPSKPKMLVSGIYKVGKTWWALGFPEEYCPGCGAKLNTTAIQPTGSVAG